jgi:hypothetical protein
VVDPQRDVEQYVQAARGLGCRIGHVLLTHFHADFVAGHLELAEREGARVYPGARGSRVHAVGRSRVGSSSARFGSRSSTDMDGGFVKGQHRMPAAGRASVSVKGAAGPAWCATRGQTDMRGSGWPQDRFSS